MSDAIVADAGPLIGLAKIGQLNLLRDLYGEVLIPPQVYAELRIPDGRAGSPDFQKALDEGWLSISPLAEEHRSIALQALVDSGEAQAILLTEQHSGRFLLIDEKRGRALARARGLTVAGTAGVLLAAKKKGLLKEVGPALAGLAAAGYRLSAGLEAEVLRLAGE